MPSAVTPRILDLLAEAEDALAQAIYEANHSRRGNPSPEYGSPWTTPDLPANLDARLLAVYGALESVRREAHRVNALPLPTLEV